MLVAQAERQFEWWTGRRPPEGVMKAAVAIDAAVNCWLVASDGGRSEMKITTFEEFKDLAQRGTFVPVYKEIVADLLTPVSAFLKIAEHSDYAFLLESVEGGEHVGRYSFLGKDPFLILRSRDGKTIVDRAGQTSESEKPFIATLRELMASFHSPFVPGLPRFTGGAVGYLGYDAAAWFEPCQIAGRAEPEDEGGFMVFDTVLAFDHVRHRILIIANARITGDEDLEALYQFACAKIRIRRARARSAALQATVSGQITH
jgi:anthranilate synthase component 1